MQRRIEQPDRDRKPLHLAEESLEVTLLHGKDLAESAFAPVLCISQDHLANRIDALGIEEHMLSPAKTDPLGAETARDFGVNGRIRIRAHADLANLIDPGHELLEVLVERRSDRRDLALDHFAGAAVEC